MSERRNRQIKQRCLSLSTSYKSSINPKTWGAIIRSGTILLNDKNSNMSDNTGSGVHVYYYSVYMWWKINIAVKGYYFLAPDRYNKVRKATVSK